MSDENASWRVIQQHLTGPAITPIAKKRRRFVLGQRLLALLVLLAVVGGLGWAAFYISAHSSTFAPYAEHHEQTKIQFFSDGQLSAQWFNERYANLSTKGLLSINISALQASLAKHPQVLSATVERHFPATLKVTIQERQPIGRIKLKNNNVVATYYVGRDGELFTAADYKAANSLPFITGVQVRQMGTELVPLPGTRTLAEILEGLKKKFAPLAMQISQIDMTDWTFPITAQTSVVLKTRQSGKLRFGPENIDTQLTRLGETLDLMNAEKQSLGNKLIDLTYPDKVAVVGGK